MSKIVTNAVVLGQSGTASNNFLLDTDQAGALRIRRNADGSGGALLTVNSAGTLVQPAQSMVRLNTANGYGSTNTKILRFSTVVTNQGADITYVDSATLGASLTTNTAGVYAISFSMNFSSTAGCGLSLNTTTPTTSIVSIASSERLGGFNAAWGSISWTGYLAAGAVIRPHTDGTSAAASNLHDFTIVRVA